jgi:ferredoxin-NADP reductase
MQKSLAWQIATITNIQPETPRAKSFTLSLPDWAPHRAGQHYDVRLTAPDGYQAQRSYSIASEPERRGEVDLTIERIPDGEVSTYMHDVVVKGDRIEVRGPIGGYFVWDASSSQPLLLIAGGSGIVPLMSMIRHRNAAGAASPTHLLYSARSLEDVIYYNELQGLRKKDHAPAVFFALTRVQPDGWKGYGRRIDREMLTEVAEPLGASPQVYICGPTALVETAAELLVQTGVPAGNIRTERFGPTGG